MKNPVEADVLIVGGGTTGLAIARELSKFKVEVIVVDKNADVCSGEVKGSHGFIYSGVGLSSADSLVVKSIMTPEISVSKLFHRDTLKTRLTTDGFSAFPSVAKELDIEFKLSRRVIVGKDQADFQALQALEEICKCMDFAPEQLDYDGILALEPHISKDFTRGFTQYGDVAYIYPWEYGIALAENARANGVRIMVSTEVQTIQAFDGGFLVGTSRGPIRARFVVNAAGPYADKVAEMAGVRDFGLTYTRSQMLITDKRLGGLVNHVTCSASLPGVTKLVRPTPHGNLEMGGAGYRPATGPEDIGSKQEWVDPAVNNIRGLFPDIHKEDIIRAFVGVRVFNTRDPEDHIFEVSKGNPNFLNAVTRLPGLALTPAMAKYIVELLGNQGLALTESPDFSPRRERIPVPSRLSTQERAQLIRDDPRYGRVVCRCEQVTEGEIVEAIRRGAVTLMGVKYRTRATMGRCQGNHCGPRIMEILSRELDIPMTEVTLKGGLSYSLSHPREALSNVGGSA